MRTLTILVLCLFTCAAQAAGADGVAVKELRFNLATAKAAAANQT